MSSTPHWQTPPLFIIGAARSGTTILGDVLAAHPDVAYWVEPKYVWRHGGHGVRHDAREPAEATPAVAVYIRRRFEEFARRAGRRQFVEKTPSNCFRVAFMHRVFPEGRFLHVLRDGRDAAASALRRWCSAPDDQALARRLRRSEIPLTALHHYLPDLVREAVLRRLRPQRGYVWGPRYPGLMEQLGRVDVAALCAEQWVQSMTVATRELAGVPPDQVYTLRYEEFVARPLDLLPGMLRFAGLHPHPAVEQAARGIRRDAIGGHASLPEGQRRAVETICGAAMRKLGLQPA